MHIHTDGISCTGYLLPFLPYIAFYVHNKHFNRREYAMIYLHVRVFLFWLCNDQSIKLHV
jgi:hypothetical protein